MRVLVAGHVLHEHIRLTFVGVRILLEGIDSIDDLHRALAVAQHGFGDGRPRLGCRNMPAFSLRPGV